MRDSSRHASDTGISGFMHIPRRREPRSSANRAVTFAPRTNTRGRLAKASDSSGSSVAAATKWTVALGGIGTLLVPKCPFCVVGYGAALAALGIDTAWFTATLRYVAISAVGLSATTILILAARRRDFAVAIPVIVGAVLVVLGYLDFGRPAEVAGSAIVVATGWANARRCGKLARWPPAKGAAMKRIEPGSPGVVVYSRVPVRKANRQHAYAYLHILGAPRTLPSHVIRAFLNDPTVHAASTLERPSFAGEFATYNSPPPHGTAFAAAVDKPLPDAPGAAEIQIDVSEALERLDSRGRAKEVDVSLVLVGLDEAPLQADDFQFDNIFITRRTT